MIRLALIAVALSIPGLFAGECIPVAGDRILGRDLKAARAGFDSLADDQVIALAPAPGVMRVLSPQELTKLGNASVHACFERAARPVSVAAIEAAMRTSLAGRDIQIQITDYSKASIPEGTLDFPLTGLTRPPVGKIDAAVLWRGRLHYDGVKTMTVWATVNLSEERQWVETSEQLNPDKTVGPAQLRNRTGRMFPYTENSAVKAEDFIGKVPRRRIPAGQMVTPAMFAEAPVIFKGEPVEVTVVSAGVELRFDGLAETSGRRNDTILVFDPSQGRRFTGKVIEKGKVVIDAKEHLARTVPDRSPRADSGHGKPAQEIDVENARGVAAR